MTVEKKRMMGKHAPNNMGRQRKASRERSSAAFSFLILQKLQLQLGAEGDDKSGSSFEYNVIPNERAILPMFPPWANRITDEKWKCAYELFGRALELPSRERLLFTQSATTDSEVLRLALELIESTQEEDSEESSGLGLTAGDRIGRYEVIGKLGQGGIGSVYSAQDTDLRRMAALKVLTPGLGATELAAERLVREARAASALNHPHIVTVYELVRLNEQVALAMELVEGKSMRTFCGEAQPAGRVMDWGRQIAQALAAAHEHGIVHGDIKPENLMVRPDGYIKVLDFGLARQLMAGEQAGLTNSSGMPGGTLNYMSPEQTRGERPTHASDIFSLGLTLYELATGTHPFATDSVIDTAHAIAHNTLKQASALDPEIPGALNGLIGSMLAKDPGKRPSAEGVVSRLAGMIEADRKHTPRRLKVWLWVSSLAACMLCGSYYGRSQRRYLLLRSRFCGKLPRRPVRTESRPQPCRRTEKSSPSEHLQAQYWCGG